MSSLEGLSQDEINGLASVGAAAARDPKLRREFLRLVKATNPNAALPELEQDERLSAFTEAQEKRIAEMEAREKEREARAKWDALRAEPVKAGLVQAEEMEDLEKFMKENGYNSTQYMQAAKFRSMERQMAQPTPADFQPKPVMADFKDFVKDPSGAARKTAYEMIAQMRSKSSRI